MNSYRSIILRCGGKVIRPGFSRLRMSQRRAVSSYMNAKKSLNTLFNCIGEKFIFFGEGVPF